MVGIYMIRNIKNNKKYIGQSVDINKRLITHIRHLKKDKHHNKFLQKDFNKYGEDAFKTYVLRELSDKDDLDKWEMYYINLLSTQCYAKGYNISTTNILQKDKESILNNIEKERVNSIEKDINTAKEIVVNIIGADDNSSMYVYDNKGIPNLNISTNINETLISCSHKDFNRGINIGEHCVVASMDDALDDTLEQSQLDICLVISYGMLVSIYTGKIYGFDSENKNEMADEFRIMKENNEEDCLRRYVGDIIYDNNGNDYRILRAISNFSINI